MSITGYAQTRTVLACLKENDFLSELRSFTRRQNWDLCLLSNPTDLKAIPRFVSIIDRKILGPEYWKEFEKYSEEYRDDTEYYIIVDGEGQTKLASSYLKVETEDGRSKIISELKKAHRKNSNRRLREYYEGNVPVIQGNLIEYSNVSGPLLISLTNDYENSGRKVLIVGQQTNGWGNLYGSVEDLISTYEEFSFGKKYHNSPFWRGANLLYDNICPDGPKRGFMWTNIVKADVDGKRPSRVIEEIVAHSQLFQEELCILQPEIVVFFTGPNYDERLEVTFPGFRKEPISDFSDRIISHRLPDLSYRTYHPKWLQMTNNFDEILKIVKQIQRAC